MQQRGVKIDMHPVALATHLCRSTRLTSVQALGMSRTAMMKMGCGMGFDGHAYPTDVAERAALGCRRVWMNSMNGAVLRQLTKLDLARNDLDGDDAAGIQKVLDRLTGLQELSLADNGFLRAAKVLVEVLPRLVAMESLDISKTAGSLADVAALLELAGGLSDAAGAATVEREGTKEHQLRALAMSGMQRDLVDPEPGMGAYAWGEEGTGILTMTSAV